MDAVRERFPETSEAMGLGDDAYWRRQREQGEEAAKARNRALAESVHGYVEDLSALAEAAEAPVETAEVLSERALEAAAELRASPERRREIAEQLALDAARAIAERLAGRLLGGVVGKGRRDEKLPDDDGATHIVPPGRKRKKGDKGREPDTPRCVKCGADHGGVFSPDVCHNCYPKMSKEEILDAERRGGAA